MRHLPLAAIAGALALASCSLFPASTQADISNFAAGLANKATADLNISLQTAQTPAPNLPGGILDQNMASCVKGSGAPGSVGGLLGAQAVVNQVIKTSTQAGSGAVTAAEVASVLIPGGPQVQALTNGLVVDCGPKIAQVTAAVAGSTAWFNQLAAMFAIQLAP